MKLGTLPDPQCSIQYIDQWYEINNVAELNKIIEDRVLAEARTSVVDEKRENEKEIQAEEDQRRKEDTETDSEEVVEISSIKRIKQRKT